MEAIDVLVRIYVALIYSELYLNEDNIRSYQVLCSCFLNRAGFVVAY